MHRRSIASFGFASGERDEQREFGLTIPIRGWTFDLSSFRTGVKNYFDHDVLGNSNIFFPVAQPSISSGWACSPT